LVILDSVANSPEPVDTLFPVEFKFPVVDSFWLDFQGSELGESTFQAGFVLSFEVLKEFED